VLQEHKAASSAPEECKDMLRDLRYRAERAEAELQAGAYTRSR